MGRTIDEDMDIKSVCFGILCNFTPVCGEERAKEAVEIVRQLQKENNQLRARVHELETLRRTEIGEDGYDYVPSEKEK